MALKSVPILLPALLQNLQDFLSGKLLTAACRQITGIGNLLQYALIGKPHLPKGGGQANLTDKVRKRLDSGLCQLFLGLSVCRNLPYLFRHSGKLL